MSPLVPAVLMGSAVAVHLMPPARRPLVGQTDRHPAARPLTARAAGAGVAAALLLPAGPVAASVAGVLALLAVRAAQRRRAAAARKQERLDALEAMTVLSAELRAGRPPTVALERASAAASGPAREALRAAAAASALGEPAAEPMRRAVPHSAVPHLLSSLAVCWDVCQSAGSSLAKAVDRLESALRAEQAAREETQAELEGPRTSAVMLSLMPVVGLLLGAGLGGDPVHLLLRTKVGWACLVAGVGLDLAGLWWTARIVRAAGGED